MYLTDTEIPVPIYKKLNTERKNQGRTIHWLADNLDLSYQHTYRLLNGTEILTENNLQKIKQLLQVA